jgi:excisionase family DNA binding protein
VTSTDETGEEMTTPDTAAGTPAPLVYTVSEAARLLGISRDSAYAAAARGELPTLRIGKRLVVPRIRLHALLGGTEAGNPTEAA